MEDSIETSLSNTAIINVILKVPAFWPFFKWSFRVSLAFWERVCIEYVEWLFLPSNMIQVWYARFQDPGNI